MLCITYFGGSFRHSDSQRRSTKSFFLKEFVKFIYSEKATKFCEIFTLLLTRIHTVKSKVKISQNFVAFSEYMNFGKSQICNTYLINNPRMFNGAIFDLGEKPYIPQKILLQ